MLETQACYHGLHTSDLASDTDVVTGTEFKELTVAGSLDGIIGRNTNVCVGESGLSDEQLGVGEETESLCWCNC